MRRATTNRTGRSLSLGGILALLAINAMGIIGGIGLLRLREWGRQLAQWATWASLLILLVLIVMYLNATVEARVESLAPLLQSAIILVVFGVPLALMIRALRSQTIRYAIWSAQGTR